MGCRFMGVLSSANFKGWVYNPMKHFVYRSIRLCCLKYKHGGVWMHLAAFCDVNSVGFELLADEFDVLCMRVT